MAKELYNAARNDVRLQQSGAITYPLFGLTSTIERSGNGLYDAASYNERLSIKKKDMIHAASYSLFELTSDAEGGTVDIFSRTFLPAGKERESLSKDYEIDVIPGALLETIDSVCQALADKYGVRVQSLYTQTRGIPEKNLLHEGAALYRFLGGKNKLVVANSEGMKKAATLVALMQAKHPKDVLPNSTLAHKPGMKADGLLLLSPTALDTQSKLGRKFVADALKAGGLVWIKPGFGFSDRRRAFRLGYDIFYNFFKEVGYAGRHVGKRIDSTIKNMSSIYEVPKALEALHVPTCLIGCIDDTVARWNEENARAIFSNIFLHPLDRSVGHGTVLITSPEEIAQIAYEHLQFSSLDEEDMRLQGRETDNTFINDYVQRRFS